jgi:hypothetical protein
LIHLLAQASWPIRAYPFPSLVQQFAGLFEVAPLAEAGRLRQRRRHRLP